MKSSLQRVKNHGWKETILIFVCPAFWQRVTGAVTVIITMALRASKGVDGRKIKNFVRRLDVLDCKPKGQSNFPDLFLGSCFSLRLILLSLTSLPLASL